MIKYIIRFNYQSTMSINAMLGSMNVWHSTKQVSRHEGNMVILLFLILYIDIILRYTNKITFTSKSKRRKIEQHEDPFTSMIMESIKNVADALDRSTYILVDVVDRSTKVLI